jgi:hypothetical protein
MKTGMRADAGGRRIALVRAAELKVDWFRHI